MIYSNRIQKKLYLEKVYFNSNLRKSIIINIKEEYLIYKAMI